MKPNSIESIRAALEIFDGCEFDLRLTKDKKLVLHHNAWYNKRRIIDTDFGELDEFQTFSELLRDTEVVRLVNENNKLLFVEVKENYKILREKNGRHSEEIVKILTNNIRESGLNQDNIYIISFCQKILDKIRNLKRLLIVPYVNCSSDGRFLKEGNLSRYRPAIVSGMCKSITHHIRSAKVAGYAGLLFPKQYFLGFFSLFQPSLKKVTALGGNDFILGVNGQTPGDELYFRDLIVFTDNKGLIKAGKRKNALICHRGLSEFHQ